MEFLFNIFLLALIFIKLPPFYFIPIPSPFFVTHTFAKVSIFLILTLIYIFDSDGIKNIFSKKSTLIKLIIFYFLSQSISVIKAGDILLFLKSYQNIISGILILILSAYFLKANIKRISKINLIIYWLGIFLIFLEFVFIFFNHFFIDLIKNTLQKEVLSAYITDFERGRSSIGLNLEIFIPFFFVFINDSNKVKKNVLSVLSLLSISFLSILSNFRIRAVTLAFNVFFSFVFFVKNLKKILDWKKIVLITITVISAIFISNNLFSFNIYDRLSLKDEQEDVSTIEFRINNGVRSFELFLSSPFIGIGLGNYSSSNKDLIKFNYSFSKQSKYSQDYAELVRNSPHNVFFHTLAENGLFGLISYLLLIFYFIKGDWNMITRSNKNQRTQFGKACIIGSWSIFIFMLFNPSHTIFVTGWFWALRGFREALI